MWWGGLIKTRAFPYSCAQTEAGGGTEEGRIKEQERD